MYKELLTDAQWNWLLNNQNIWYNEITVLWYSNDSQGVVICQLLNGPIYRFYTLLPDGTMSGVSTGQTGHDIYVGIKTGGQYLYADNGIIYYDSRLTIGIPINTPLNNRYEFDYIKIKDSKWLPANIYKVIENLSEVDVLPKDDTSRFNLALKWDTNMANKYMSPYLYQWTLGSINEYDIALMLKTLYLDKWNKSYDALIAKYNPIDNYNMKETSNDETNGSFANNNHTENTGTVGGNSSMNNTQTGSTADDVYAFNSSDPSKDRSSNSNNTNNGSSEYSDNSTSNSNGNSTGNNNSTTTHTLNRSGNIGVTTTQKMITEELELRKYILLDEVFNDISKELTLRVY